MAETDIFPIDPDYTVTRTKEGNVLRGRVESAREFFRRKAAPRRVFVLLFQRRAQADWEAMENFRLRMMTDFFTFDDKTAGRQFSVTFDGEPVYEEAGHEQHNLRVQLIEAVGVAMQTYPSFAAGPAQNLVGTTVRKRPPAPEKPPLWGLFANLGGNLRLNFAIPRNADYRTGDLTLLVDPELERVATTVAAAFGFTDTTLQVASSAGFLVGDLITIAGSPIAEIHEVLKIAGPGVEGAPPTSNVWQVARAQKLTENAIAVVSAPVYRLLERRLHFVLPPGFTLAHPTTNLSNTDQHHVINFRPGRLRILHAALAFTGIGGVSEPVALALSQVGTFEPNVEGTLSGMRVAAGGLGSIQVPGPLATGADLAMPLALPNEVSIGVVYAAVAKTPTGQPIRFQLQLDGVNFGPVGEIPVQNQGLASGSGVYVSGARRGNVGAQHLSLNILQVGSGDPGEDLTIHVTV